jgi:hypothetical protein
MAAIFFMKFGEVPWVLRQQHPAFLFGTVKMVLVIRAIQSDFGRGNHLMAGVLKVPDQGLVVSTVVKVDWG